MSSNDQIYESLYPQIAWRKPLKVTLLIEHDDDAAERWACRLCIAAQGLKGRDVSSLWTSPEAVLEHIAEAHPLK